MKATRQVADVHEVVMDATTFYEGALAMRCQIIHEWRKSQCQNLGDYLGNCMNKAYGSEVLYCFCSFLLRDQNDCCLVEQIKVVAAVVVEGIHRSHHIRLDDWPASLDVLPDLLLDDSFLISVHTKAVTQ